TAAPGESSAGGCSWRTPGDTSPTLFGACAPNPASVHPAPQRPGPAQPHPPRAGADFPSRQKEAAHEEVRNGRHPGARDRPLARAVSAGARRIVHRDRRRGRARRRRGQASRARHASPGRARRRPRPQPAHRRADHDRAAVAADDQGRQRDEAPLRRPPAARGTTGGRVALVYYSEIDPYAAEWLRNLIAAGHLPAGDVDERDIADVATGDLAGYRQCHFFAGIGGWPYALRLAGWPDDEPVWTGSCPCQPLSSAGQRKGHADDRHLWPAFYRLI